jgi:hypothetical protein
MHTKESIIKALPPFPQAVYGMDVGIPELEKTIDRLTCDHNLDLNPDFQRGHVWTQDQKKAFLTALVRGAFPHQGVIIQFNKPHWSGHGRNVPVENLNPKQLQIIDGLQRLTAVREFVRGDFNLDGEISFQDLLNNDICTNTSAGLRFVVLTIPTRKSLLEYYLGFNGGGTLHSPEELNRVQALLDEEVASHQDPIDDGDTMGCSC